MRFSCENCGQHYEADDSFAGEDIKCSKCDAAISIPKIEQNPEQIIKAKTVPPLVETTSPAMAATSTEPEKVEIPKLSMPDLFKNRMREQDDGAPRNCPNCGLPLESATAIICIECGYNTKLGINVNDLKK